MHTRRAVKHLLVIVMMRMWCHSLINTANLISVLETIRKLSIVEALTALGKQKYFLLNTGICPIAEILWKTVSQAKFHWNRTTNCWVLSYGQQYGAQINKNLAIANRQYIEGIYRPNYSVTFKSRLRVTQGHCKRNHWTDHTRLSSNRVIDSEYYRDLEMLVRGQSRSLKIVRQRVVWPWKQG